MFTPRLSVLVVLLALALPAAAFARPIDLPPTPIPPAAADPLTPVVVPPPCAPAAA
jgi:hypothetical protein